MKRLALTIVGLMLLTSCGSTHTDRAASGAGIGAGVGTTAGLLIGGPIGGLLLGSAVGTFTGLITDQDQINLGEPLWNRNPGSSTPPAAPDATSSVDKTAVEASKDKAAAEEVTKDWDFDILE